MVIVRAGTVAAQDPDARACSMRHGCGIRALESQTGAAQLMCNACVCALQAHLARRSADRQAIMTLLLHGGPCRGDALACSAQRQSSCLAVIDPRSQQLVKLEEGGRVGAHGATLGTHMFSERNSIVVRLCAKDKPSCTACLLIFGCCCCENGVLHPLTFSCAADQSACRISCTRFIVLFRTLEGISLCSLLLPMHPSTLPFCRCALACACPTSISARRMC